MKSKKLYMLEGHKTVAFLVPNYHFKICVNCFSFFFLYFENAWLRLWDLAYTLSYTKYLDKFLLMQYIDLLNLVPFRYATFFYLVLDHRIFGTPIMILYHTSTQFIASSEFLNLLHKSMLRSKQLDQSASTISIVSGLYPIVCFHLYSMLYTEHTNEGIMSYTLISMLYRCIKNTDLKVTLSNSNCSKFYKNTSVTVEV